MEEMSLYQTIDLIIKIVAGLTAFILFIIGFIRYRKDQLWKKKEFVSKEIKDFFDDATVHNCLLMLDYDTRYIELYPKHPEFAKRFAIIGRKEVTSALIPHGKFKQKYSRDESLIRDCFDHFLDRLGRFEHYIQANLIKSSDLEPYLRYWINTIFRGLPEPLKSTFQSYVIFYENDDIVKLFSRFNGKFEPALTIEDIIFEVKEEPIQANESSVES